MQKRFLTAILLLILGTTVGMMHRHTEHGPGLACGSVARVTIDTALNKTEVDFYVFQPLYLDGIPKIRILPGSVYSFMYLSETDSSSGRLKYELFSARKVETCPITPARYWHYSD